MWLLASVGGFVTQEQGQRARGMAGHGKWGNECVWVDVLGTALGTWALLPVSVCPWPSCMYICVCVCVWQFQMVPEPSVMLPILHAIPPAHCPFSYAGPGHSLTP